MDGYSLSDLFSIVVMQGFSGLSLFSVLLLMALGLAIIFGQMGVINMAHGEFMTIGAYTIYLTSRFTETYLPSFMPYYFIVAILASFVIAFGAGYLLEYLLIRHLYKRPLDTLLATWGLSLILQQAVRSIFGPTNQDVSSPDWMSGFVKLGGLTLTVNRLWIILFAGLVLAALGWWLVPKEIPPLGEVAYLGLPYILAALVGLFFAWRGRLMAAIGSLGAGAVALTGVLVLVAMPALDALKPSVTMGRMIRAVEGSKPYAIATWHWFQPSFLFYAGRGAMPLHEPDRLTRLAQIVADGQGTAFLALPEADLAAVRKQLPKSIHSQELYAGYELYSRKRIALLRLTSDLAEKP